ncbi:hypothetical protein [Oleiharenicola sp. Vm1]|uniref:hypothetical protein n=1 Tax=Oleiharenicola sp. Vm1 TaxID=3398393 RepID=UPI0039F4957B
MLRRLALALLAAALAGAGARADSRESAFWGRELLGPDTWSRVVLVENATPTVRYPAKFYALVFEFEGLLWFYTESDGTQSLSQQLGQVRADKQHYLALARSLHDGFTRVIDGASDQPPLTALLDNKLPRGCFLYCLLNWRRLETLGTPARGQLLTYYVNTPDGARGHTILLYRYGKKHYLYDPADTELERPLFTPPPEDPLEAANVFAIRSGAVFPVSAVLLDVHRTSRRVKEPVFRKRTVSPSLAVSVTP